LSNLKNKKKLRLVYISDNHSKAAGGVPAVVNQLSSFMAETGFHVNHLFVEGGEDNPSTGVIMDHVSVSKIGAPWGWSRNLKPQIQRLTNYYEPTVFHIHGIWSSSQYFSANIAKNSGVPFLLSSHGMLEPYLWNEQGWKVKIKKEIYWRCFAYPVFKHANIIHAITPLERDHLKRLFPDKKIEVIPNAIYLDETTEIRASNVEREQIILFLGRIEPKKGVDILLHAFAKSNLNRDWRLVIIGPVWSNIYYKKLNDIVIQYNMEDRVNILGSLFDEEKNKWLRKAWIVVVPSHSEVVGLVNLEAAACNTPSITTRQTGLYDWDKGGGVLIEPDIGELVIALKNACSWSNSEQVERGNRSRQLVLDKYSWRAVLPQWHSLYMSLLEP
tara:strand:+ start:208 stop:1365 length:1158 start_codon:yes stop_codon:yes gene_type:complete